jgi:hypothetical protein
LKSRPAQVKLLKCLVDNIVVDVSYFQRGGLLALRFLEEVDKLLPGNLLKRAIILVSAAQHACSIAMVGGSAQSLHHTGEKARAA